MRTPLKFGARASVRARRAQGAFSVTEVLVALALSSVVLGAAGNALLQSYNTEARFRQRVRAQHDARVASDMIADDLKGAIKVTTLVPVGTRQIQLPTDTVLNAIPATPTALPNIDDPNNPLTFSVYSDPRPDNQPRVWRRVRYWRQWNAAAGQYFLHREIEDDGQNGRLATVPEAVNNTIPDQIIARGVTAFSVQYPAEPILSTDSADQMNTKYRTLRLTLQVSEGPAGAQSVATIQTDVHLRNNSPDMP